MIEIPTAWTDEDAAERRAFRAEELAEILAEQGEDPEPCKICVEGCDCDGIDGNPDCGHFFCFGNRDDTVAQCPSAAARYAK